MPLLCVRQHARHKGNRAGGDPDRPGGADIRQGGGTCKSSWVASGKYPGGRAGERAQGFSRGRETSRYFLSPLTVRLLLVVQAEAVSAFMSRWSHLMSRDPFTNCSSEERELPFQGGLLVVLSSCCLLKSVLGACLGALRRAAEQRRDRWGWGASAAVIQQSSSPPCGGTWCWDFASSLCFP